MVIWVTQPPPSKIFGLLSVWVVLPELGCLSYRWNEIWRPGISKTRGCHFRVWAEMVRPQATSPSAISQGSKWQVPNDRNVHTLTRHQGLLGSGVWPFHHTGTPCSDHHHPFLVGLPKKGWTNGFRCELWHLKLKFRSQPDKAFCQSWPPPAPPCPPWLLVLNVWPTYLPSVTAPSLMSAPLPPTTAPPVLPFAPPPRPPACPAQGFPL